VSPSDPSVFCLEVHIMIPKSNSTLISTNQIAFSYLLDTIIKGSSYAEGRAKHRLSRNRR